MGGLVMKLTIHKWQLIGIILGALSVGYCSKHIMTTGHIPASDTVSVQKITCPNAPLNLTDARKAVEAYYESGCIQKERSQVIDTALGYFKEHPASDYVGETPTVIFDVDDTLLDQYAFIKSIKFGCAAPFLHEWALCACTPVIREVKVLYDYLITHGFTIIFLTGRNDSEHAATLKNFELQGITGFEKLITRSPEEKNKKVGAYKSAWRKMLVRAGYVIVGCVGDQWSDFEGGNTGYQVKIPNYMYKTT